ncbi:hypothetical protein JXB22_05435 [candidate division WOR-3 bacterium]|nr:hypothetical protein [candidate division WOR-3 bacterium]
MDKFVAMLGIIGLVLLAIGLVVIVQSLVSVIKKRSTVKGFFASFVVFLIMCGFGLAFASIALFLHTFSRFSHEERIGYIHAEEDNDTIIMTFVNEKTDQSHFFNLTGDQWMIEGYIMRWSTSLRWLGAGSYVCITRFAGRDVQHADQSSVYQIAPENTLWRFLLRYGAKIPFVDAAYGIGAFQYPSQDAFFLYVNDTGFIIKKK